MKPKYNIGDKVWRVHNNRCIEETISGVQLVALNIYQAGADDFDDMHYEYSIAKVISTHTYIIGSDSIINHEYRSHRDLFPSKEALLAHLAQS